MMMVVVMVVVVIMIVVVHIDLRGVSSSRLVLNEYHLLHSFQQNVEYCCHDV
jgi:hypothetical protein